VNESDLYPLNYSAQNVSFLVKSDDGGFTMKKSKFTEQQIAFALRKAESGTRVAEVCRKLGIN
jgi:hypothetical protein